MTAHSYKAVCDTAPDGRTYFTHIFENRRGTEACGYTKDEVVRVAAREVDPTEATEEHYWAWEDADKPGFHMIWFAEPLFRCCFTYGVEAAVKAGKGRVVRLAFEEAEDQS
jgi:hypothetical protein